MSEPFENKYRQCRMNLTAQKVINTELRDLLAKLQREKQDYYYQIKLAHRALIDAGYRRLEDMSWTNEPMEIENE